MFGYCTMKYPSRFAAILGFCLTVAGCDDAFSPIQSAQVMYWQGGRAMGAAQQLSAEQVAQLSAWLQGHRSGWQAVIATYAPSITILAVHADGTERAANLMQRILVVGQHQRAISEAEYRQLRSIVGGQNGEYPGLQPAISPGVCRLPCENVRFSP